MSIGLPVHEGERFLDDAIRSIRTQTFRDFELVVSDNASTDRTAAIIDEHARDDPRIRVHRWEENVGASRNFNHLVSLARGRYFRWAADDDRLEPTYLARCVEVLDADPSVVLCTTGARFIDETDRDLGSAGRPMRRLASERPSDRFRDLVLTNHLCLEVFGLVRIEVLRRTPLLAPYINSDRVLLAELGLRGKLHVVSDELFRCRDHPGRSVRAIPFHLRSAWFDPARAGERAFPHLKTFAEFRRCLERVPLDRSERRRCRRTLARWWTVNANWARAASDLLVAAIPASYGLLEAAKRRWLSSIGRGWDDVRSPGASGD